MSSHIAVSGDIKAHRMRFFAYHIYATGDFDIYIGHLVVALLGALFCILGDRMMG